MASGKTWMRYIKIELYSKKLKKAMSFGDNSDGTDNFTISISGTKYPASLKDKGTVTIMNLPYNTIVEIIEGEFYGINIWCGYKGSTPINIFNGAVSYISKKIRSNHDTETYICYASQVVANYSQKRMDFTINSGINLYAAYQYICNSAGIKNPNISQELREKFTDRINSYGAKFSTILDCVQNQTAGTYTISVDGTEGSVIDVTTVKGKRLFTINDNDLPLLNGNPTISSDGLRFSMLPIFNFKVGDIIEINNALIDISVSNAEEVISGSSFKSNYMDTNGRYMIIELGYIFENRGQNFRYDIKARALDIISKYTTDDNITITY